MSAMVRELFITLYLLFYKVFFSLFSLFPIKNKVVFLASFVENNEYVYSKLKENFTGDIVFLCKNSCFSKMQQMGSATYLVEQGKIFDEIKAAYHLMTAKTIIVDNYFGLLAAAKFRNGVECIQIWHAVGAIKSFGFLDPFVQQRSNREKKRILSVYENFHKVVVGSKQFEKVFEQAFYTKEHQFLHFGYPRTDFFHDEKLQSQLKNDFFYKYPHFNNKKIILYAPTFRPNNEQNRLALDIEKLYEQFGQDYVLLVRMHPSVTLPIENQKYTHFLYDFSKNITINELLVVTDYLITDYSSIPFEYSIYNKPMIFYPYDLEEYEKNPGLWDSYENIVPGPIAQNTEEIINILKLNKFPDYAEFHLKWNEFCLGQSSEKLVSYILQRHYKEE